MGLDDKEFEEDIDIENFDMEEEDISEEDISEEDISEEDIEEGIEEDRKPEEELVVYLVIDRPVHGLINYFRQCGVYISNIFTTIEAARNAVLMQSEHCRIVVADTGLGKFTTTKIRQELIDMIGICDENNRVTVFYTDSVIKVDTMRELDNSNIGIDWVRYKGTAPMVARILQYEEVYKGDIGTDKDDELPKYEDIRGFMGLTLGEELDTQEINGITSEQLISNMLESEDGLLPMYDVKL